ncbi:MAG: hypothetical protein K8L91_00800 [Anaerolineae bacterium]|nr:hypothetical protein [Anaerolineae bacterium]
MSNQTQSRLPVRRKSPPPRVVENLTLQQVGLGPFATVFIVIISTLPMTGLLIGLYYQRQKHYATRAFGRTLLMFAIFLHFIYFCVLCPMLVVVGVERLF